MNEILLSIVVPTKNRGEYLKKFIQLYSSFDRDETELVIQDNSDEGYGIQDYIKQLEDINITYNYIQTPMPVIENSELAILNSHGKYVCFMGDDDLLSSHIVDVVRKMDMENIDSASFKKAVFNWPGIKYAAHHFPSLTIPKFSGRISHVMPRDEYYKLLDLGATDLGNEMPQLYHGIVKRAVLDDIRDVTGTYFPGPSPDMAVATCLACFVKKHIYVDAPFISSGKSPKSAAGLGAEHRHKGNLGSMSFLPTDIEEKWDLRLPFIWTGPTIYAESAIEAIKSMGKENDLNKMNFSYFYAYFDTFFKEYRKLSKKSKVNIRLNQWEYIFGRIKVFCKRARIYINNKILLHLHYGAMLVDAIPDCVEAEKIIDGELEKKGLTNILERM